MIKYIIRSVYCQLYNRQENDITINSIIPYLHASLEKEYIIYTLFFRSDIYISSCSYIIYNHIKMMKWNQQLHSVLKQLILPIPSPHPPLTNPTVQHVFVQDIKSLKSVSFQDTKISSSLPPTHRKDSNDTLKDKHKHHDNTNNTKSSTNNIKSSSSSLKYFSPTNTTSLTITHIDLSIIYSALYHILHHSGLQLLFNLTCHHLYDLIITLPSEYLQLICIIFITLLQNQLPSTTQHTIMQQAIHIIITGKLI